MNKNKRILFVTQESVVHPVQGDIINSGDFVYFTAGASFFYKQNVQYLSEHEVRIHLYKNADYVKDNFDIVITMHSDLFRESYYDWLTDVTELYSRFKVPIYVFGVCLNTLEVNYEVNFSERLNIAVKKFVSLILNSGGDLTLRGSFTQYYLEKLGFKNLFVSGCPSLFMRGENAVISTKRVDKDSFNPCFNANAAQNIPSRFYEEYPKSKYVDQYYYLDFMYEPWKLTEARLRKIRPIVRKLYLQSRLIGDKNYAMWIKKIQKEEVNFFYGRKLHGNIVGLQYNIPCFIVPIDTRVREVCDFYSIPNIFNTDFNEEKDDLYELYKSLDFSEFNSKYKQSYKAFEDYLKKHGIPNNLGDSTDYFSLLNSFDYYDFENDERVITAKKRAISIIEKINSEE